DHLRRLASGDGVVEHHFSSYFREFLSLKLRVRIRSPQLIEDIRQETLLLNIVLLLAAGYAFLKIEPERKREVAEARAPQFVQDVPVLGVARGPGSTRKISAATRRIVFSFYLPRQFQNL